MAQHRIRRRASGHRGGLAPAPNLTARTVKSGQFVSQCDGDQSRFKVWNGHGTNRARIAARRPSGFIPINISRQERYAIPDPAPPTNWRSADRASTVNRQTVGRHFHGVTGGTLSVAGGISMVLKSAGLTISRYSMSGE